MKIEIFTMHHRSKNDRSKAADPTSIRRLKALFAESDRQTPIDGARKAETLQLLYQETKGIEKHPMQGNGLFLFQLVRYADRNLPGLHLLSCAALPLLLTAIGLWDASAESMLIFSMILPGFLACLSAFEVRQICFFKMAELGGTCFFHVRQLAALSMMLSGIMNLIAVAAGILLLGQHWQGQLFTIGLYVLVPFVFTQCICFGTMLTETGRKYAWMNVVLTLPLTLCCMTLAQHPMLYTPSALFIWAAALLAGIVIFIAEIRLFFARLGKGDILCTNWS